MYQVLIGYNVTPRPQKISTMFAKAFPEMHVSGMRGTRGKDGVTPSIYGSWLQKAIRRGLTDQAIYAAAGLFAFSTEDRGAPLLTFLLNRIEIIAMEDIGFANPFLTDSVMTKVEQIRNRSDIQAFNILAGVIKALCESPKTRLSSWIKNALGREKIECDIGPFGNIHHVFSLEATEIKKRKIGFNSSTLSKWLYSSGRHTKKEWIYGLILVLIRPEKGDEPPIEPLETAHLFEKWVTAPEVLEGFMKDIVMDIHTGKKKKTTESKYDFAIRGAHVENETIMYPQLKEFYNECKRTGRDGYYPFSKPPEPQYFCKDSDIFTPTSNLIGFKTPTLFGKALTGDDFFFKLMYPGTADFAVLCHQFRKKLGLYSQKTVVIKKVLMTYDYCSMALESSAKASVRTIEAMKKKCSDIVDVLMVTQVEGGSNMCQVIKSKGIIDMLELMKVLLFRRYVESTDTNTNNMVVDREGRVLSVDENPAEKIQYDRWAKMENPDTVFTAQRNANMPDAFVHKLKVFSKENEDKIVEFLRFMKATKFSIHRNEEWIDRMIETRLWF